MSPAAGVKSPEGWRPHLPGSTPSSRPDLLSKTPITYVSVGSDPELMHFHDELLELYPGGQWRTASRVQAATA